MKEKVLLGMSGGVDSSVAAILLKEQGFEVIGATMKLWQDDCNNSEMSGGCCSMASVHDAKRVCDILEIPHYVFNFTEEFKKYVVNDFINCYENAITPNPCIECNKYLKFDLMYKKAQELNIKYIATGHYAKTCYDAKYKQYVMKKSNSKDKDQTYVLYNIPQKIIKYTLFPLGNFKSKEEIRQIAKKYNLAIAKKPDSQEICFIPDNNKNKFMEKYSNNILKEGNIVNSKNLILGKHKGLTNYTVGQRKGLAISSKSPLYVIKLDKEKNEVVVGTEKEIYNNVLFATDINLIFKINTNKPIVIKAKTRYNSNASKAVLTIIDNDNARINFTKPEKSIAPGQSIVFYINDYVIRWRKNNINNF